MSFLQMTPPDAASSANKSVARQTWAGTVPGRPSPGAAEAAPLPNSTAAQDWLHKTALHELRDRLLADDRAAWASVFASAADPSFMASGANAAWGGELLFPATRRPPPQLEAHKKMPRRNRTAPQRLRAMRHKRGWSNMNLTDWTGAFARHMDSTRAHVVSPRVGGRPGGGGHPANGTLRDHNSPGLPSRACSQRAVPRP